MKKNFIKILITVSCLFSIVISCSAGDSSYIASNYFKKEFRIPMRDGKTLFTAVYIPKDTSVKYPVLMWRTPYNLVPYGEHSFPEYLGPSVLFTKEKYIFVYQDVRGRFMSEGEFENLRPDMPGDALDESRDTYDTIEWLLKHLPYDNGKVGMWGISYPGFYSTAASIDAHPALAAVSPQAPIANWFLGDDWHHNGAFMLPHAFPFMAVFGQKRIGLTKSWPPSFKFPTEDGYKFYKDLGPIKNTNKNYLKNKIGFWNEMFNHPNYDDFWKARNILPHLKNIKPAVLVVGGWFDAENLYGALNIYEEIEKNNPGTNNYLVMGPWFHGGWARSEGDKLGKLYFNQKTSAFYQDKIELSFFNYYLKGKGNLNIAEASVFETGTNTWKYYTEWPPKNSVAQELYFHTDKKISFKSENEKKDYDEYVSDPDNPMPYLEHIPVQMPRDYMGQDQSFASKRNDVIVYKSDELKENITVTGPLYVDLYISTTGTDADFIIKLIDEYPDTAKQKNADGKRMAGFEMLVRGDVMRAKFRNSFEKPEPITPGKVTKVSFKLQDVNHTFLKGHRIIVQAQSTWFPLIDRNPQKFVNIYEADENDFSKQTHRIYHTKEYPSGIKMNILKQ